MKTALFNGLLANSLFEDLGFGYNYKLVDNGDVYSLRVALPGTPKENISVKSDNELLTVSIEGKKKYTVPFYQLQSVSVEDISAKYENGMLEVTIPKSAVSENREIEIT